MRIDMIREREMQARVSSNHPTMTVAEIYVLEKAKTEVPLKYPSLEMCNVG